VRLLVLPEPKSVEDIARLFSTNRLLHSKKDWLGKPPYVEYVVKKLFHGRPLLNGSREYDQVNLHLLYRAVHQANEACNKLWSTVELYHHAKSDRLLCTDFS